MYLEEEQRHHRHNAHENCKPELHFNIANVFVFARVMINQQQKQQQINTHLFHLQAYGE